MHKLALHGGDGGAFQSGTPGRAVTLGEVAGFELSARLSVRY